MKLIDNKGNVFEGTNEEIIAYLNNKQKSIKIEVRTMTQEEFENRVTVDDLYSEQHARNVF